MCSCVSYVFGLLKTVWLKYSSLPRSLLPGKLWQKNRPNTVISVFVPSVFCFRFFTQCFCFLLCPHGSPCPPGIPPAPAGEKWIHFWPRAQPTYSLRCGASARAHRWRRAISLCDQRASAKLIVWTEDRPGSWAQHVKPGARAGNSVHHEGASRGRWERRVELHPLHRGLGWADSTSETAEHEGGSDWLDDWAGDRTAPFSLAVIPAGLVQPSFVFCTLV